MDAVCRQTESGERRQCMAQAHHEVYVPIHNLACCLSPISDNVLACCLSPIFDNVLACCLSPIFDNVLACCLTICGTCRRVDWVLSLRTCWLLCLDSFENVLVCCLCRI